MDEGSGERNNKPEDGKSRATLVIYRADVFTLITSRFPTSS